MLTAHIRLYGIVPSLLFMPFNELSCCEITRIFLINFTFLVPLHEFHLCMYRFDYFDPFSAVSFFSSFITENVKQKI